MALFGRKARLEHLAERLEGLLGEAADARDPLGRIEAGLDAIERLLPGLNARIAQRHDITRLPTREPLFAAIAADARAAEQGGLLALVELVDFDRLNAFDSALADAALSAIAGRLTRMVGERRIVASVDRARLAVWFGGDTPVADARAEQDAIGYALRDVIALDGREIVPEIRTSAVQYPAEGATPEALVTRAIAALAAGSPEAAAAPDPAEAARKRYTVEQELRQAVARNQFELAFQPLVDAAEQRVCGAEALLRWRHPALGLVSPDRFVPVVEEAGLAEEVGLWTLNAACREASRWQREGLGGLHVAVNLSAQQLHGGDLRALVERTLARHSLAPGRLLIELTETLAAGDAARTAALFASLHKLGVAIAIDDFGTGYSSLAYLMRLSFDKLKIDREFVTEVDRRRESQAICHSIIALGRGLGIRVLAEGVERFEEYAWLRRHGCTLFQGYWFARPLAPDAFVAFARDRAAIERMTASPAAALQSSLSERMAG